MDRATMYLYLMQPNDVLRDAEAAESNGQTDLSNIVDLEGNALLWRGGKEDLEQAVRLFRLLLQLPPSTRFLPGGGNPAPFRLDALGSLGRVSYKLGKFDDAIRDAEGALKLFYENQGAFQSVPLEGRLHVLKLAYLLIIASNLRLGKPNDAGIAASTWLDKSNDPLAQRIVFELGSGQFNAAGFLKEYEGPLVTPQAR
jgi:tetratricopeptide (TPR) repeat protein